MLVERFTGRLGSFNRSRRPDFDSGEQTVTLDTLLTLSHFLGATPNIVHVVLRCKTANLGYAVGNEIFFTSSDTGSGSADQQIAVVAAITAIFLVQGQFIKVLDKSNFDSGTITTASWKWVVRAWR